jgi:ribonuclease HI
VLLDKDGGLVLRLSLHLGEATNNSAEYQALILGAMEALERGVEHIQIYMDSQLVVNQVNGRFKVKSPALQKLRDSALRVLSRFVSWRLSYIPREENREADKAAREGSARGPSPRP